MNPWRIALFSLSGIIAFWLFGLILFTATVLLLQPQSPNIKSDAIIVLTGGNQRVETGLRLFAKGDSNNIFISGVHPNVSNKDIRGQWKEAPPLPDCCITLGKHATTTIENAQEIKEWISGKDIQTIRLVTSNYHMPRAYLEVKSTINDKKILLTPIMQDDLNIKTLKFWGLIFEEYHKFSLRGIQILTNNIQH